MNLGRIGSRNWDPAPQAIVVRMRWFGVAMGYVLVQLRTGLHNPSAARAFLALGAGFAGLDTAFHRMGEVFLQRWPLFVSLMESVFITLLCYHDTRLTSPFRWYYLLSSICAAIRFRPSVAWITWLFHTVSFSLMAWWLGFDARARAEVEQLAILLAWATWASSALAGVLRSTGDRLQVANEALERNRAELERRVDERTSALRAAQARFIHQEKMAGFGLLAAGIAHEVGNPLAALSSLVQMLQHRGPDPYTAEKLALADRQLARIQRTIRELVDFSRPASTILGPVRLIDAVDESLGIAKYYHRTKDRAIVVDVSPDLPTVLVLRDHLVQVILNLVLNAVDATEKGGEIEVIGRADGNRVLLEVVDDGRGIHATDFDYIFQPYFTTKPQGTGLGLFVSKQILEDREGTLTFTSAPGKRTAFQINLPTSRCLTHKSVEEGEE